mmetsp:Transcript_41664/g.69326  ORF Transcript_41664/g.69326 Transcript_41664/m.69326 type:complete len:301 (-) Transcript_41664:343-1245(-)
MSASDGGSTQCSNWQCARASSASAVWAAGSDKACSNVGTSNAISGFRMTEPILLSAKFADSLTLGCGCVSTSVRAGTTWGSVLESCLGAQYAIAPSNSTAACFVRHFSSSSACSREGRTILTPCAESLPMMRCDADTAACRTPPAPSATLVSSRGRMVMTYGSNRRPSISVRHSKACSAPSRALVTSSPRFLSSTAAWRANMTPCCLSDVMPRPFTTPASPNAAPRLAAYLGVERSVVRSVSRILAPSGLAAGADSSIARDCATVRCTTSDGVPSASTSRDTTCSTLASSDGICLASEPM